MRTAPLLFLAACSCPDESRLDPDSDPFDTEPGAETDARETDPTSDTSGESGDDSACPEDCEAVVGALDGLRWELPCLEPASDPRVCVRG